MSVYFDVAAGCVAATLLLGGIATASWYLETSVYGPLLNYDSIRHEKTETAIKVFWLALLGLFYTIPILVVNAGYEVITGIMENFGRLFWLMIFGACALGLLQYHDSIAHTAIIIRQCVIVPFCYYFLFPFFNIVRMVYNAVIILWDFGVDMYAFYEWGPILIFIKCTIHTTNATDLFGYFGNIFYVFSTDLVAWFSLGFMTHDLDITNTLDAIGIFLTTLVPPFTCLCKALNFFYTALAIWVRLPSLHACLNCILNFFITLAQIPINTVMNSPFIINFEEPTLRACCAVKTLADALEDTIFIIVETGWGIFSGDPLPEPLLLFFSTHWAHVAAEPICAVFKLANMTLTMGTRYDELDAPTGIAFFQFGHVFDEFKQAVNYLASIFCLFNNDAQAFIDQALLVVVNAVAFVFEWIPGNIYYWLYGGPLPLYPTAPYEQFANFLAYYFPNYWLLPTFDNTINNSTYVYHTALDATFTSLFMTTQALGNLIANLLDMDPLGGIIQHTLNIIVCLLQILFNLVSFSFAIITFSTDVLTTARQVNFDNLFNEMYFLAGSSGDFFRQFADKDPLTNLTCQVSPDENENSVFCCLGDLVENVIDLITVGAQQIVHFLQDLVTIPTGNVVFCLPFIGINATDPSKCLRIPDMSVALFLLDEALCDFTCAIASVIPLIGAFQCSFPPPVPPTDPTVPPEPPIPCGHVSTCIGVLTCRILRLLLVPLYIYNSFFVQTIQGVSFADFTVLGSFMLQILCNVISDALAAFGLLINCTLCAFTAGGTNCDDSIYQIFLDLGQLVRFLPLILTRTFMLVLKLVLALLVGLFNGDPLTALVQFIVGVLTDLFGGLGEAVINLIASVLDAIGLGFLGDFIKLLWKGFCGILQVVLNGIILVLKAITLGMIDINWVNLCCNNEPNCTPGGRKRARDETNVIDGVLTVNLDEWVGQIATVIHWDETNPCNQTIATYSGYSWNNLTDSEQDEVMYCLVKHTWLYRNDSQTEIRKSMCDNMIIAYNNTNWSSIGLLERQVLIDCVWSRLYVDAIRVTANLHWIPSDILTNPYRKWVFSFEFARGMFIYWQYYSDKTTTSAVFTSSTYQENWRGMGLNTSHYEGVNTVDDILRFRDHYRLKDYFEWNGNATQYQAVMDITTGAWRFGGLAMEKLLKTITAKSDTETDPTVYLQYSYNMDSASAGITSSFYGLISDIAQGFMNMTAYWSNPENVKKRSGAGNLLKEGAWGIYQAGKKQLTMISTDWWLAKRNESRYWSGNCSADEAVAFTEEYNTWLHEDERSLVYHLSRWYERNKETMFTTHKITHPREGDRRVVYNQSASLFEYKNEKGVMVGESGRERLSRFYDSFSRGTPQSQGRWRATSRLLNMAKERVYVNIIRNNMETAVDYVNTVYKTGIASVKSGGKGRESTTSYGGGGSSSSLTPSEEEERYNNDLLDRFYKQKEGIRYVSKNKVDYEVLKQRKAQQDLYCKLPEYENDGLCKGWVAPPPPPSPDSIRNPSYDTPIITDGSGARYTTSPTGDSLITNDKHATGTALPQNSFWNVLRRKKYVTESLIKIDSFIDLTCYTNITFDNSTLCDECFIVDQALGRVETGLGWVMTYFVGGQFGTMVQVAFDFFNYAYDDFAYVIVGSGPQLSVHGFPGFDGTWYYNLEYVNDNTPNKTRIQDLIDLINTVNNETNSSIPPTDNITTDYFYLNAWIAYFIIQIFNFLWNLVVDLMSFATGSGEGGITEDVFSFFTDWFVLCDWLTGEDYRGVVKRFSIGETILMFTVGWVVLTVFFYATVGFSPLSFLAYTSTSLLVTFSFFLSIQVNFAFLCFPGLPATLLDDILYFIFYTLVAKCEWFFAFLIDDDLYDNNTCFFCENAGGWHIINCATQRGFGDIIANIVFMLEFYAPEVLQWVRDSRWVPVAIIYQIPWVNERLNAFTNVDMSNPKVYAQYMGCNYIITGFLNLFLAIALVYVLSFFLPAFNAGFTIFISLLYLLYLFYLMLSLILQDLYVTREMAPFTSIGLMDTPVPEQVMERPVYSSSDMHDYDQLLKTSSRPFSQRHFSHMKRTMYSTERKNVTFSTLKTMARVAWDGLFPSKRKTK